jgi:hypothetical protein
MGLAAVQKFREPAGRMPLFERKGKAKEKRRPEGRRSFMVEARLKPG